MTIAITMRNATRLTIPNMPPCCLFLFMVLLLPFRFKSTFVIATALHVDVAVAHRLHRQ